jgi:hypothetical protein
MVMEMKMMVDMEMKRWTETEVMLVDLVIII